MRPVLADPFKEEVKCKTKYNCKYKEKNCLDANIRIHDKYDFNGSMAWPQLVLHTVRRIPWNTLGGDGSLSEEVKVL